MNKEEELMIHPSAARRLASGKEEEKTNNVFWEGGIRPHLRPRMASMKQTLSKVTSGLSQRKNQVELADVLPPGIGSYSPPSHLRRRGPQDRTCKFQVDHVSSSAQDGKERPLSISQATTKDVTKLTNERTRPMESILPPGIGNGSSHRPPQRRRQSRSLV